MHGRPVPDLMADYTEALQQGQHLGRRKRDLLQKAKAYHRFFQREGYLLTKYPAALFALGMAQPLDTPIPSDFRACLERQEGPEQPWFRLLNPPRRIPTRRIC